MSSGLTCEEVLYREDGHLITRGPSTYKIPAVGDVPLKMNVHLLENAPNTRVIGGSKAVGEPPFMHGIAVVSALRAAIAAFSTEHSPVNLTLPATPEAVLRAVVDQQNGTQD